MAGNHLVIGIKIILHIPIFKSFSFIAFIRQYPHYRCILVARFLGILTARMLFTIMGWEIYRITQNPLFIGLIGFFEVVPAITCGLFAGNIIDSHDRKRIAVLVSLMNLVSIALLAFLTWQLSDVRLPYVFFAFSFITGILRSFWASNLSAIVPDIIPKEKIPQSGPYFTGSFLFGSVIGHALGGFLVSILPIHIEIGLGSIFFLVAFFHLRKLPTMSTIMIKKVSSLKNTLNNILEGLHYVYNHKVIFSAILLDMLAVLFGGVVALLPIYARDILFISPSLFGWLNASMDIGAGIGIIVMGFFPMKRGQGLKMLVSVFGFGIGIILFAFSRNYLLSITILVVCGFFDSVSMVVRGIILQSYVPDYIRGRVMSVSSIFISSSNELGQFESGLTSRLMGVIPATLFGGVMTLVVVTTIAYFSPQLRKLEWENK